MNHRRAAGWVVPEPLVRRCIDLCARIDEADGELRTRAVAELGKVLGELESLIDQRQGARLPIEVQSRVLAQLQEPVIAMDLTGYVTGWNKGAETLFGYTAEEAIGRNIVFLDTEDAEAGFDLSEIFESQGAPFIEVRRRKKSGESVAVGMSVSLLRDEEGEAVGIAAHLTDLSARASIEQTSRLHARIFEDSDQGILITDAQERIVSVNTAFTRITGFTAEEALGNTPDLLRSGQHDADFRAQVRAAMLGAGPWQGEIIGRRKNGELFPQSVSISVVRNDAGRITHAFSIFSDVSVLRAAEDRLQRAVNYDTLTGLPNRTLFNQLTDQALATAKRNSDHVALLVVNLNRFTAVNDTLGFEAGDELLRQVGARFRETLRTEDILARVGGDEFVASLVSIQKREHGGIVAQKLLAALAPPFDIGGHQLHVGAAIGVSVFPEDGTDTGGLVRFADVAMKKIKDNVDSGYLYYSPEMNARAKEQLQLEGELRHALKAGELRLYYQPKVSLRSGKIVGAEALIRWIHPVKGMVSPGKFIPVAEETGLILDLGNWVLEEACRQIAAWQAEGATPPPVAVNLSARQFDEQLPERVRDVLDRHRVEPDRLKLEITESLLVRGAEVVIPIMNALVAAGLSLALDDFGTGYSSLAYLKKFPIDTLKIDRSFVIGVPAEANDCAIAKAIVTMGQQLRQEIVAEGVETVEQMNFLRGLGCDQLQGFLFSPPVPAEAYLDMLREGKRLAL